MIGDNKLRAMIAVILSRKDFTKRLNLLFISTHQKIFIFPKELVYPSFEPKRDLIGAGQDNYPTLYFCADQVF